MKRERTIAALVVGGLLMLAACGDDDEPSGTDAPASDETSAAATDPPSTEAPSTEAPSTDVPATEAPTTDVAITEPETEDTSEGALTGFCSSTLEVERAVDAEDPARIEDAFTALQESAPEEIASTVESAVSEAEAFLAEDGEPTDAFNRDYLQIAEFVSEDCEFQTLEVVADDYLFGGLGGEIAAGPTVFFMVNESGQEVHEMVLFRKNEGVTESFEELLSMPERKAMRFVTEAGGTFAVPGEAGADIAELEPGEYIALCFVPEGTTIEAMEEMESGGAEPEGQPHFMLGMQVEFTVT